MREHVAFATTIYLLLHEYNKVQTKPIEYSAGLLYEYNIQVNTVLSRIGVRADYYRVLVPLTMFLS